MNTNKVSGKVWLIFLTASALAIRLFLIFKSAPAGDEIWVWLLTKASFKDIWLGTLTDINLPFFYLFLRASSLILGFPLSIFWLRLPALFFGILALVGIGYLAYFVLGRRVGMIAFVLSLFLPASIWASVVGRYYSFLILLTSLAMLVFIRFLKTNKLKNLVFLTGIATVGIYTHYYFFLLVLSFGAYLVLTKKSRFLIKSWFYSLVCLAILFLPALFYFLFLPKQQIWMSSNLLKIPASFMANVVSFEALLYAYYQQPPFVYFLFFGCFLVILVALLIQGLRGWKNDLWLLFLLVIVFPPTIALLASFILKPFWGISSVFGVNSLLIFLPAFLVVLAKGIDFDLGKRKILSVAFFVLVFLSLGLFFQAFFWRSIFAKPFQFVEVEFKKNDLVLHADIYTFIQARYYLGKEVNFGVISTTYPPQTEKALGYKIISHETIWQHQGRVWYFEPVYFNMAKEFKAKLDKNLILVKKEEFGQSLTNVYLYSGRTKR